MAINVGGSLNNYKEALEKLNGQAQINIGYGTWLIHKDENIIVKYIITDIVTYHPDGSITIQTGGFNNRATFGRLKQLLRDHRIYCLNGKGIIEDSQGNAHWLYNTVKIDSNGLIISHPPIFAKELGDYLKQNIPDTQTLCKTIASLNINTFNKIWNRFKSNRQFIIKYCPIEFLPMVLGFNKEKWVTSIISRLSDKEIV